MEIHFKQTHAPCSSLAVLSNLRLQGCKCNSIFDFQFKRLVKTRAGPPSAASTGKKLGSGRLNLFDSRGLCSEACRSSLPNLMRGKVRSNSFTLDPLEVKR